MAAEISTLGAILSDERLLEVVLVSAIRMQSWPADCNPSACVEAASPIIIPAPPRPASAP